MPRVDVPETEVRRVADLGRVVAYLVVGRLEVEQHDVARLPGHLHGLGQAKAFVDPLFQRAEALRFEDLRDLDVRARIGDEVAHVLARDVAQEHSGAERVADDRDLVVVVVHPVDVHAHLRRGVVGLRGEAQDDLRLGAGLDPVGSEQRARQRAQGAGLHQIHDRGEPTYSER